MRCRAPAIYDAPAVLALLVARERADLGVPDDTIEDVLDEWLASDVDLAADARLVEAGDGAIVGYVVARGYWRMARTLDDLGAEAAPPAGVMLRPVDVARDAPALHALDAGMSVLFQYDVYERPMVE